MFNKLWSNVPGWIGNRSATRRHKRRGVCLHLEQLESLELLTVHPGLLYTQADFDRMAAKVAQGADPWVSDYNALVQDHWSNLGQNPAPLQTLIRGGTGENFGRVIDNIHKAFNAALIWNVSHDNRYGDQAVRFLNGWQYTMTSIQGNADRFLAAGIYGYQWANIAEMMRSYSGWAAADVAHFQSWLLNIWYPMSHSFLVNHNGASYSNYFANWDLCNMADVEAIGVFSDRPDLYNEALTYFYHGVGNGAIDKAVFYTFDGYLGQWEESGRDQGHSMFGIATMGAIMQMAWNQGDDLFSYENNKFLMAAEYFAKYNLGNNNVPFEPYARFNSASGHVEWAYGISSASRGAYEPGFALIYNHYVNVEGLDAPYSAAWIAAHGNEGSSGSGDELGYGTLTYSLDPIGPGQTPSGLTAKEISGGATLNWWGEPYATSYNVYRSTDGSSFTQIASGITGPLTYTDQPGLGAFYYEVTGNESGGETAPSNVVLATTVPARHTQLSFNESGGTTAYDNSGNGNNGTLMNGASFTGSSVQLNGSGQYVSLPTGLVSNLADFTVATWVNLASNNPNTRIFDFGDSNGRYMFLSPRSGSGLRFAFGLDYYWEEQAVGGPSLPTNQWVHVAVTQSGRTVTLYINGAAVGSTTNQDFQPFQLGASVNNWIGRSQYPADPYLNGQVKDFRIYHCALSAGNIAGLAGALPAGWSDADIGNPGVPGSTNYDGFTWTVAGGGGDIWNRTDQFHFASESFSGNGTIIAHVTSVQNTNGWAKAGVMFRDSSAANAMYAYVMVTPGNGVSFQYRSATGGSAALSATVGGLVAPEWVELTRSGNVFSAFYSADGVTWTQVGGNVTINMSSNALVGLAVTAHNNSAQNASTLDNVSVTGTASSGDGGPSGPRAAPSNLGAVALANTGEIDLSWTNDAPAAGTVLIERSADGVNLVQVAAVAGTATTYADTAPALKPRTQQVYGVRARTSTGYSDDSGLWDVFSFSPQ